MLTVSDWSTTERQLDFSSAGLPSVEVRSIHVHGELLCNAYELAQWEAERGRMQLVICEHCGTAHCSPGGWVTFRRSGEAVFVLPLFTEITGSDEWARSEYGPPPMMGRRGVLLFARDVYARFRETFPRFPEYASIPPMTCREALMTYQLEVPGRLLGDPGGSEDDRRRLDLVLAASEGDPAELLQRLVCVFDKGLNDHGVARITTPQPEETVITLYVDLPDIPEWQAFWKGKTLGLYLSPQHRVDLAEEDQPER